MQLKTTKFFIISIAISFLTVSFIEQLYAADKKEIEKHKFVKSLKAFAQKYQLNVGSYAWDDIEQALEKDDYANALDHTIPILIYAGNTASVKELEGFISYFIQNGVSINNTQSTMTPISRASSICLRGKANNTIQALLNLGANPFKKNTGSSLNALQNLDESDYIQKPCHEFLSKEMEAMKKQ